MLGFRSALAFFTRLPVGAPRADLSFQGLLGLLPAVGLVVGAVAALAVGLTALVLPAPFCGAFGCLAWIAVTGGLHLDGVADCGDGLYLEAPPEKRLVVMRDSRLGAFGGIALFSVLIVKTAALSVLGGALASGASGFCSLLGACCLAGGLGRCTVFIARRLPSARPEGLGSAVAAGTSKTHEAAALVLALGLCALNGPQGWGALAAVLLVAALLLSAAWRRLGGVTGDVYGCLIETGECAALTVCCLHCPG